MSFLQSVQLGKSGLIVSELCFGTLTMSRIQADLSPQSMVPVFQRALELGITFYDTAQRYYNYQHVRLGLGSRIGDVVIASKTSADTLEAAREQVEECFRELNRDMIDIYLLHQVDSEAEYQRRRPVLDYLLKLKSQGKIRAVGISCHDIAGNRVAVEHADELDILFPVVNQRGLGMIGGTLQEGLESIEQAKSAGLGIYAMKPLGGGHLRHDARGAIGYLRKNKSVDAVCVGIKSIDEVDVNVAIFSEDRYAVEPEKERKIIASDRKSIVNFLCERCGACLEHCDQGAIRLDREKAEIDQEKCILCGYCAEYCPQFAIRII